MTIKNIGPVNVQLHQERDYKTSRVIYETATVSRVVEYNEVGKSGKNYSQTLSVSVTVTPNEKMDGGVSEYNVNWSALGSVPLEITTAYIELLNKSVEVAGRLTEAYVTKT